MYLSGARFSGVPGGEDKGLQSPVSCKELDSVIDSAVAMGQDPYAALAISFMENGTHVARLYLDPIGLVGALGCPANRVSADGVHKLNKEKEEKYEKCSAKCSEEMGSQNKKYTSDDDKEKIYIKQENCITKCESLTKDRPYNLNSYGTFYKVQYGTIENNVLSNRIKKYIELQNPDVIQNKSGFICGLNSEVEFYEKPAKDRCCLATQFMPKDVMDPYSDKVRTDAKNAFTFNSLRQYVQAPLSNQMRRPGEGENAARRIQRFNGYSDLMGGAETVSAWRSGVNYNNHPAYGYQAMDFVYNSLMSNPMVVQKIEAAQKKYGAVPSIVCADRPAGAFYVSSDLYFNKHAQSTRMDRIQKAWDSGMTDFKKLSRREQNVLKGEFGAICDGSLALQSLQKKLGDQFQEVKQGCSRVNDEDYSQLYPFYMKKILPLRRTVAQASEMDQGYTWKNISDEQYKALLDRLDQDSKDSKILFSPLPYENMKYQGGGFGTPADQQN